MDSEKLTFREQVILGGIQGALILTAAASIFGLGYDMGKSQAPVIEKEVVKEVVRYVEVEKEETVKNSVEKIKIDIKEKEEPEMKSMGMFRLTAYCSCEICCDEWALNRPLDENGNEIVYTASGTIAKEGRTIGVDPDVIPYGTEVIINGHTYVAEDTGGAINGNHIDVYHNSHETALKWPTPYAEVFVKGGAINGN